jgi:small multidrug resistance pump
MLSIFVEIAATTMTKQASDSGSAGRMTLAMGMYVTSLLGFAASLPKIDVSVAYAVWSALGTAFVSAAGILLFGEKCDRLKIASILMIVAGVVGLNMSEDGGHH